MDVNANRSTVNPQNSQKKIEKYVLSDVSACTFTFSNGGESCVTSSPDQEIILMKLIPHTTKTKVFHEYVLRNYSACRNASELGIRCGYNSQKTFTRHFKKFFGETPYQWMLDKKMDEIRSLVLNSDITLKEIAELYGFKNLTHLVNAYTSRFGMPPIKSRMLTNKSHKAV
ncbi:MAG TPA: AraC family transcriptional regulator [Porphyromonadaceae bacterium]|jgi:AraC-like DNA-binding protein|uniref:helix-turn-helix domain-containing protein n=1 Tax=Limibacterium fermenti TaxID=3229863 RepID=UPI000E99BB89|nr:AraC family transcriptional regulator [Porphyromonadaceae bacterium]HBK31621.1 AraC family transcriptional regulator [Porphyromonadaceae bacterium]HBL33546.1 AraC family transcriptional regulator [Porphyromonadaceae bacterium]HBX21795.1 AraC family transcriptional regulator [Porphyromonadaceae bacterium]HCM19784.1 AraC family transcriptional regulator [Porphyromonadaceae bacterium]